MMKFEWLVSMSSKMRTVNVWLIGWKFLKIWQRKLRAKELEWIKCEKIAVQANSVHHQFIRHTLCRSLFSLCGNPIAWKKLKRLPSICNINDGRVQDIDLYSVQYFCDIFWTKIYSNTGLGFKNKSEDWWDLIRKSYSNQRCIIIWIIWIIYKQSRIFLIWIHQKYCRYKLLHFWIPYLK